LATRRRYRDGGVVKSDNSSGADVESPVVHEVRPAASHDADPVKSGLEAIQRAEELARQQQQRPAEPQLSQWKRDFLASHPDLVKDEEATSLTRYHYLAALRRGIRDDTPAMNEAILSGWSRMRGAIDNISHEPARDPAVNAPEPRKSVPISAPVSRDVPSVSSGRSSYVDTKLSPEERDIARRSFTASDMTDAQKEYEYWRNREKMRAMRRNGTLNE
jgi:hypothetical protein